MGAQATPSPYPLGQVLGEANNTLEELPETLGDLADRLVGEDREQR